MTRRCAKWCGAAPEMCRASTPTTPNLIRNVIPESHHRTSDEGDQRFRQRYPAGGIRPPLQPARYVAQSRGDRADARAQHPTARNERSCGPTAGAGEASAGVPADLLERGGRGSPARWVWIPSAAQVGDSIFEGGPALQLDAQDGITQSLQFGYNCDFNGYFSLPYPAAKNPNR